MRFPTLAVCLLSIMAATTASFPLPAFSQDGAAAPVADDIAAPEATSEPAPAMVPTPLPNMATEVPNDIVEPPTDSAAAGPEIAAPTLPHDLSPGGMFMQADYIVKGVMIGLALAALLTWTVWLAKSFELMGAKSRARRALRAITKASSLDEAISALERKRGVGVLLLKSAEEEVHLSMAALDHAGGAGLKERVSSRLARLTAAASRRISRGTGLLASIGSVSPFVGLFGTVWGIMNAFIGISEAQTTNLAVVAPGIAEALLATALGLVAAIPAVVIYNVFARSITGYRQLLADIAAGIERLISRDLDYRAVPQNAQKAAL